MTRLAITPGRGRGDYVLRDEEGRTRGSLTAGWTLRHARIRTGAGDRALRRRRWQQVDLVDDGGTVLSLGPDRTTVPGPGPRPTWTTSREDGGWHGSLHRGSAQIDVVLAAPRARRGTVDVTGDWEQLDPVVLTACFALVLRHRRRAVIAAGGA